MSHESLENSFEFLFLIIELFHLFLSESSQKNLRNFSRAEFIVSPFFFELIERRDDNCE